MTAARDDPLGRAFTAFSSGKLAEAAALCEAVLARAPRDSRALELAAAIALSEGRPDVALQRATAAVASRPSSATAHQTRGQVLRSLGRNAEAEGDFERAARLDPGLAEAHASLGTLRLVRSDFAGARPHLERAVALRPGRAEWHYNLALCELGEGRLDSAAAHMRRALQSRPGWPEALAALGAVLVRMGRAGEAMQPLQAALASSPAMPGAWNNLGVAQLAEGRPAEALASFRRWAELVPADADPWVHQGNALRTQGDRQGAEAAYREALQRDPQSPSAHLNLGNLLREMRRQAEAGTLLERAVALDDSPEAHLSLSFAHLAAGHLERGWQEYGWRHGAAPLPEAQLRSALQSDAVVLRGEQGLGDQLFFLRWASAWLRSGAKLHWGGDARLARFAAAAGISVDAPGEATGIFLGDLPRVSAAGEEPNPPAFAVKPSQEGEARARKVLAEAGGAPCVAVAWRAGLPASGIEERLSKNVPLRAFAEALSAWPGAIVAVQRHPGPAELRMLRERSGKPVLDAAAFNDDLDAMAALLACVDLYAGVSSTNVHLAAGVGLAAHVLVPDPPEWRYGAVGASAWFPRFALHRENPEEGWAAALANLATALAPGRP